MRSSKYLRENLTGKVIKLRTAFKVMEELSSSDEVISKNDLYEFIQTIQWHEYFKDIDQVE